MFSLPLYKEDFNAIRFVALLGIRALKNVAVYNTGKTLYIGIEVV